MVLRSWYIQEDLMRKIVDWINTHFFSTFCFTEKDLTRREALLRIKNFILHHKLKDATSKVVCLYPYPVEKLK
jgi:hypothetical protein